MKEENLNTWRQIISETKRLWSIEINWHVGKEQSQLLCFCNALKDIYGTTNYVKTMVKGKPQIKIFFAKSRISPKKTIHLMTQTYVFAEDVRSLKFVSKELSIKDM